MKAPPAATAPHAGRRRDPRPGRPTILLRTTWFSARIAMRTAVVVAVLVAVTATLAVATLGLGRFPVPVTHVLLALAGSGDAFERAVVVDWRFPVVLAAAVFGALLGGSGAIFQSLTRNPLGSPDVIGFDAGSYTAVVVAVTVFGADGYATVAAAAVGGLATAVAVYLLAYRGGTRGFRLIVVGIGVAATLGSLNSYLVTRANLEDAMTVGVWSVGSISRVTWAVMVPSLVLAVLLALSAAVLEPARRGLELGDDLARAHGVRVGPAKILLVVVAVAMTALVTAAAGPIGFVALSAPQLARRLTRTPGVDLAAAAAMGATLLTAAHLLGTLVARSWQPVPVGVVTLCLGGAYLGWLLAREAGRVS